MDAFAGINVQSDMIRAHAQSYLQTVTWVEVRDELACPEYADIKRPCMPSMCGHPECGWRWSYGRSPHEQLPQQLLNRKDECC